MPAHHATVLSITRDSYRMRRHRDAIAALRPPLTGQLQGGNSHRHNWGILAVLDNVRQVPGRKTVVSDAAWLCQLAEAGLLKANFVPPKPIRDLRQLTRYRKTQIAERQREAQRLHKALEDTNIKL